MKLKTLTISIFVVLALAQIAVPLHMIYSNEKVLRIGQEFKFRTSPIDPYDQIRGKYVHLNYDITSVKLTDSCHYKINQTVYASIYRNKEGYARIYKISILRPASTENYIEAKLSGINNNKKGAEIFLDFAFNRYYMDEYKAPEAEKLYQRTTQGQFKNCYAKVRVLNGKAVVQNVILNKIPIEILLDKNAASRK